MSRLISTQWMESLKLPWKLRQELLSVSSLVSDGTEGEVDLKNELTGEVFEPLRDPSYFASFQLHPELHTLSWPNGADFVPEFLLKLIQVRTS